MSRTQSVSMGLAGLVVAGLMVVGTQATAASIVCSSTDDDRYMTLDPVQGDASCAGVGAGMTDNKPFQESLGLKPFHENTLGLFEIEKLEDGVNVGDWFKVDDLDETYGSIEILNNDLYSQYSNVHLAFFFGNPNIEPNWMSYSLDGVFQADWAVTTNNSPGQGNANPALSNVALWGSKAAHSVPAPGALGLFSLGLMGLVANRLRRPQ